MKAPDNYNDTVERRLILNDPNYIPASNNVKTVKELVEDILRSELTHLYTKSIGNTMTFDDARKLDVLVKVTTSVDNKDSPIHDFGEINDADLISTLKAGR